MTVYPSCILRVTNFLSTVEGKERERESDHCGGAQDARDHLPEAPAGSPTAIAPVHQAIRVMVDSQTIWNCMRNWKK
jgi:hypothetical protein